MTPDTLVIDRTFKGVGRIKRATGSTNPSMRRKLSRMLTALQDEGRLDILRAIRDGAPGCSFLEVWDAYSRKALDQLPIGATAAALDAAYTAWLDSLLIPVDVSDDHRRSLGASKKELLSVRKHASVSDLPAILEELRKTKGATHPRTFNLARAAALAFVRSTLKKSHPLWLAIAAVEKRKDAPKKTGKPMPPDVFGNYFPHPDSDAVDAMAWTCATSGMHQKEYWGNWRVLADRIHVGGTKRAGRKRDVPLVRRPVPPSMHRRTFENKLRERLGDGHTPYDLRRTYSHWMELAGIPRTRRRLYLGHSAKDVTDLYERHEVDAYLAEDAKKLRALLGLPAPTVTLRLEQAQ